MRMKESNVCEIKPISLRLGTPLLTAQKKSNNVNEIFSLLRSSLESNGFIEYMRDPQKMIQHHASSTAKETQTNPDAEYKFFHGIWMTNPDNPKGLNEDLDNFITQSKKLPNYKAIIWTNIEEATLLELSPKLYNTGISIKHIRQINTQYKNLLNLALDPKKYISPEVRKNYNPYIVDLVKELVIESNGGVLADLNFKFGKYFKESNLEAHDFLAPITFFNRLENGFLAGKSHHPIFKGSLGIKNEMFFSDDCKMQELKGSASGLTAITEIFSMMPLSISYIMNNNQAGNIDTLIRTVLMNCPTKDEEYSAKTLAKLEKHKLLADKAYSSDPLEFNEFIDSYVDLVRDFASNEYGYFRCIEDSFIGQDKFLGVSLSDIGVTG
jgi:hypothetical protein